MKSFKLSATAKSRMMKIGIMLLFTLTGAVTGLVGGAAFGNVIVGTVGGAGILLLTSLIVIRVVWGKKGSN